MSSLFGSLKKRHETAVAQINKSPEPEPEKLVELVSDDDVEFEDIEETKKRFSKASKRSEAVAEPVSTSWLGPRSIACLQMTAMGGFFGALVGLASGMVVGPFFAPPGQKFAVSVMYCLNLCSVHLSG
jgi:hypothetical protein